MLSPQEFKELFPRCQDPEGWVKAMNVAFRKYDISTPVRQAAFIAQCGHESGGWSTLVENLNYSAKSLNAVFPKYFMKAGRNAEEYAHQPEKIANIVYADRMGNGDTASGDGFRYRGRGPIQITGKSNYAAFNASFGADVINRPDLVQENKEIALMAAIWFWNTNDLNKLADVQDIKAMTKRINGGYIGLEDRISQFNRVMAKMNMKTNVPDTKDEDLPPAKEEFSVIKRGSTGEGVKIVQTVLGINADGIFGKGTEAKVKEWQRSHDLYPDGIVGPETLQKLLPA